MSLQISLHPRKEWANRSPLEELDNNFIGTKVATIGGSMTMVKDTMDLIFWQESLVVSSPYSL